MHLAQINIAKARYDMEGPELADFVARINSINALADRAPGFIWRLTDDDPASDGATALRPFNDPNMLINMSVWTDPQSLFDFVYLTAHKMVMKRNRPNFENMSSPHMALWWVPAGHEPTIDEAKAKLEELENTGPTSSVFTLKAVFDAAGHPVELKKPSAAVPSDQ